jgi:tRNA(adenine34) deaminase
MDVEADERIMDLALDEARRARAAGEVPVGAVLVRDGAVLACAHNRPIALRDPSAHAEILALRAAASAAGNYRLPGTTLYVTLEPCIMCAGALLQARIARLVFGAADPKGGGAVSLYRLLDDARLNHRVAVTGGIRAAACAELLSGFFHEKRVVSPVHSINIE